MTKMKKIIIMIIVNQKNFGFVKKIENIFKKDKEETINTCRGKFYIYKIIHNNNGEIMVVELLYFHLYN